MAHGVGSRVGTGGVRAVPDRRAHAASAAGAPQDGAAHEVRQVGVVVVVVVLGVMVVVGVVVLVLVVGVVMGRGRGRGTTTPRSDGNLVLLECHQLLQVHGVARRPLAGTHQLHVRVVNLQRKKDETLIHNSRAQLY